MDVSLSQVIMEYKKEGMMLTGRSEILLQVVLGAFLLGFIYVGVEKLWIAKVNAQLTAGRNGQLYKQCMRQLDTIKKSKESAKK